MKAKQDRIRVVNYQRKEENEMEMEIHCHGCERGRGGTQNGAQRERETLEVAQLVTVVIRYKERF